MTITDHNTRSTESEAEALSDRIAAVYAAVDPDRRAARHDVLVNVIVETLARRGPLTIAAITRAVNESGRTSAVTEPLVAAAVDAAYEAHLVSRSRNGAVSVTQTAGAESKLDHAHVDATLAAFVTDVGRRLNDMADDRIDASSAERVAHAVYVALACGADGLYAIAPVGCDPHRLRPAKFNVTAMKRYINDNLDPKSVRDAAMEIAMAAIDPEDDFGNNVVRLVTVSGLLHGMLTRRDLPKKPDLTGYRLLLDTTVLVDLADDGSPEQKVAQTIIKMAHDLGVEVIVAEHTADEWERLWDAAAGEAATVTIPVDLPANTHRLAGNPFARMFAQALEADPGTNWARFEAARRDVRRTLGLLGVKVRPHGNKSSADRVVADAVTDGLLEFSENNPRPSGRRVRSKASAAADGESSAMIARWRSRDGHGPDSAYFVSHETLTNNVFVEKFGGDADLPITITPATWAMFAATLTCDDPAEPARIAELVADSAVRSMFFGMAAGCTLEEAVALSEQLSESETGLSLDDTRNFVHAELIGIIDETENGEATAARRGAAVVQQRTLRRERRVLRQHELIDLRMDEKDREAAAKVAAVEARESAKDDKIRRLQEELDDNTRRGHEAQQRGQRRKTAYAWAVLFGAVVASLYVLGLLTLPVLTVLIAVGGYVAYEARSWVRDGGSLAGVVRAVLFEAAVLAVGVLL